MKLASFFKIFSLPKLRSFSFSAKKYQTRATRPAQKTTAVVRPYDAIHNPSPALLQARAAYAALLAGRAAKSAPSKPELVVKSQVAYAPTLHLDPVSTMFTENQSEPSAQWSARTAHMAQAGVFAETPEVQAVAHLFGARVRVYMPNSQGDFELRFTGNPKNTKRSLDLVLENQHYRWVKGSVVGDKFSVGSHTAAAIQNVPGDGNCFFHCIARGLASAPKDHRAIRNGVVSLLRTCEQAPLDGADGMTLGLAAGI